MGYDVYGTDASESGIAIAKTKYPERFFIQDLSKDDLPEEINNIVFDTIISTEVIEHIYSPKEYFEFCKKVLSKANLGELILSTPYHGYLKNLFLALTGKMESHFTVLWEGGHIKFWSRKTLTKALNESGFEVVDFKGSGRFPLLWKSMIIKASLKSN
jgi:2-polyprenyl-3-methyl-5-hydroxy-6-metoxy-1,4-benzoquinol methylase